MISAAERFEAVTTLRSRCYEPSRAVVIRVGLYATLLVLPLVVSAVVPAANEKERHSFLELLADNFGLLGFTIVCLQFVIAARLRWVEWPFGLDMLFRFHRAMAMFAGVLLVSHPLLMVLDGETDLVLKFEATWPIQLGRLTLMVLLAVIVTSLCWRTVRLRFEQWRTSHNVLTAILLLLAATHSLFAGDDLTTWPMRVIWAGLLTSALAAYTHHKFLWHRRTQAWYEVSDVVQEAHDAWTLLLKPIGHDVVFAYVPGQFHFMTLHRAGFPAEEHPFSISSSPGDRRVLASTIKASGDFTHTIQHTKPGDRALVRGPYGRFSHLLTPPTERLVFVAGGIGITPFISMLRYMRDTGDWRPTVLLYANKTEHDILFRAELHAMVERSRGHVQVVHVLSRPDEGWPGERGRLDADCLHKYASPFTDHRFFVCGPPPMIQSIVSLLTHVGVHTECIHREVFAL